MPRYGARMDLANIDYAPVLLVVVALSLVTVLCAWLILIRIQTLLERNQAHLVSLQQAFLRSEYARMAGESSIMQQEVGAVVAEVRAIAETVSQAVRSGDWDPEHHLRSLDDIEQTASLMKAQLRPPEPTP